MSYKGQRYVKERRQTTGFSLHPDTIQLINKIMAIENKPKSQVVETAIIYYAMKLHPKFPEPTPGKPISPEEFEYFDRLAAIEHGLFRP